jgi:hypothetical protein
VKRAVLVGAFFVGTMCARSASAEPDGSAETARDASGALGEVLFYQLALGADAAELYGLWHYGPRAVVSGGPRKGQYFGRLELAYAYAHSAEGLTFHDVQLGENVGMIFGPLRLGVGVDATWFGVPRHSAEGGVLWHVGAGLCAFASIDVFTFDSAALALEARGEAAWLFPGARPAVGAYLTLRYGGTR